MGSGHFKRGGRTTTVGIGKTRKAGLGIMTVTGQTRQVSISFKHGLTVIAS